jgi:tryptophan synthase alpha chain
MSRIQDTFNKGPTYVGYLTTGHKGLDVSFSTACALVEGGVNVLEIGVPFSDPIGEGPVIQQAMQDALDRGTKLDDVLELAKKVRAKYPDLPLVLFGYLNPIFQAAQHGFLEQAKAAGFDATLTVDLSIEEADDFVEQCQQVGLETVFLVTPTTDPERIALIESKTTGFIYYVSRTGTTGMKKGLPDDFNAKIKQLKSSSNLPVVVGFGISNKETAAQVLENADGFVVGSKFVKAVEDEASPEEITKIAASLLP